jgi:hypothetical protein
MAMDPQPLSSAHSVVIVRLDRPDLHRAMQRLFAGLPVEVEWDRRRADRRRREYEPEVEQRRAERRQPVPATWRVLGAVVLPDRRR